MDNPDILLISLLKLKILVVLSLKNYGRNDYTETANVSTICNHHGTDTAADSFAARFAYSADAWVNGVLFTLMKIMRCLRGATITSLMGPFNPVQVGLQISGEPDGRNFLSGDALLNTSEGPVFL